MGVFTVVAAMLVGVKMTIKNMVQTKKLMMRRR